jgi:hypothetical protein
MIQFIMFVFVLMCMPEIFADQGAKRKKTIEDDLFHLRIRQDIRHSVKRY